MSIFLFYSFKFINNWYISCCCCCSVTQSCLTLCDPMDWNMTAFLPFTISQSFLRIMSTESVMPSNHLILCCPLLLLPSIFPVSQAFSMSHFFTSGDQSIGASASASLLPVNIQDWFPLGWTGWTSLPFKGLSRVFSNTTVQKHQFWTVLSFLYSPTLTSIHDYWKNHSSD